MVFELDKTAVTSQQRVTMKSRHALIKGSVDGQDSTTANVELCINYRVCPKNGGSNQDLYLALFFSPLHFYLFSYLIIKNLFI